MRIDNAFCALGTIIYDEKLFITHFESFLENYYYFYVANWRFARLTYRTYKLKKWNLNLPKL